MFGLLFESNPHRWKIRKWIGGKNTVSNRIIENYFMARNILELIIRICN
jgi:hypothetical protein